VSDLDIDTKIDNNKKCKAQFCFSFMNSVVHAVLRKEEPEGVSRQGCKSRAEATNQSANAGGAHKLGSDRASKIEKAQVTLHN
jgi:hypothetical protein